MNERNGESGSINLSEAREYVVGLLPKAGKILKGYFGSPNLTQTSKSKVDFATEADYKVDSFLIEKLKKRFPQTTFLTEETAQEDFSSLMGESNLWVIDPLDGTTNFSRKHSNFAISVALVDKGISKLGVVYIPMTRDLYWAQGDMEGAFLNGTSVKVSNVDNLSISVLACDWPWNIEKRRGTVILLGKVSEHVRAIKSMGSAVADLASLARGQLDVYLHPGVKPWDVAASGLLIEKAGGKITTPEGKRWNVFEPGILATNGILHDRILELLTKELKHA